MTVKQLGNETTTVYADGEEFVMERASTRRASSSGRR